jgi:hypothetical protein
MAAAKTQPTDVTVPAFISTLADAQVRADCKALVRIMQGVTKARPRMWGTSIVGFGVRTYPGAGGRSTEWPLIAFAPRKSGLVLYAMSGVQAHAKLLARLGPHKFGKGCLYLRSLADVDLAVLKTLVAESVKAVKAR